jgi:tRNA(Ile)-lysidine synthase
MSRSHPPSLVRLAERTLIDECRIARGERLLVAVSGGGDSTALLHVLSLLAPKLRISLVSHGVDHGLRPEARQELDLVERLSEKLEVPFSRTEVVVTKGGNVQARARRARLDALASAAERTGATRIATAHHADDRAETLLIRMLHGATPAGLAVLPPADGPLVRPFIRARRVDVTKHLTRHALAFSSDPSNENDRFLRVRVRKEVLPLLEALSPAIVSHLAALADELRAPPAEAIVDDSGAEISLKRAHRSAVLRAITLQRTARVRLPGGIEVVVDPKAQKVSLDRSARATAATRRGRRSG